MQNWVLAAVVTGALLAPAGASLAGPRDQLTVRNSRVAVAMRGQIQLVAYCSPLNDALPSAQPADQLTLQFGPLTIAATPKARKRRGSSGDARDRWRYVSRNGSEVVRALIDPRRGTVLIRATGVDTRAVDLTQPIPVTVSVGADQRSGSVWFEAARRASIFRSVASPQYDNGPLPIRQLNGGFSPDIGARGLEIATTAEEWRRFWIRHEFDAPLPAVDFRQEVVAAYFIGHRNELSCATATGAELTDGQVTVTVTERRLSTGPSSSTTSAYWPLAVVVAIPRTAQPVAVSHITEWVSDPDSIDCSR